MPNLSAARDAWDDLAGILVDAYAKGDLVPKVEVEALIEVVRIYAPPDGSDEGVAEAIAVLEKKS